MLIRLFQQRPRYWFSVRNRHNIWLSRTDKLKQPDKHKIAKTKDVPPGQAAPFTIEGQKIALFNVEGTYYAIGDTCTHRGGPLSEVDVFKAPGSPVRGTVRISTSKPSLFWGRQRRRAFQVTKS